MKKIWMVISCCTFMAACGSSETAEGEEYYNRDNTEEETPVYSDANSEAEVSAATKQSEVDTSINEIGTDRKPEVATAPAATTGAAATTATNAQTKPAAATAAKQDFEKGKTLIASSDCLACHNVDQKLVGPAYVEVAKKYEFNDKNVDYLANKIIEGGAGVWGQIPMSPHPDLSRDNAKEMAKYILSLRK